MRRNENTSAICKSILTLAVTMALSASTGALAAGEHSGGHGGGHGAGGHGSSSKMMPNAGHGGGHSKAAEQGGGRTRQGIGGDPHAQHRYDRQPLFQ